MMIEILIFLIAAICGVSITGFAVHMFVGGLVSSETEFQIIAIVCFIVSCVIGYMVWDVICKRTVKK